MQIGTMRVLEIVYGFPLGDRGGGITRFGVGLTKALRCRGFDVHLCGLFGFGDNLEKELLMRLSGEGIPAFCASSWNEHNPYYSFGKAVQSLWHWQSKYRARIIHSHSEFGDIAAIMLKFHPSRPVIIRTIHGGFRYEWRKRPWRRLLLTNILYPILFDLEIGVSQTITNRLNARPLAKILKRQAVCIHNAIDLSRFQAVKIDKQVKRNSLGIPHNVPLIGTVGRLSEEKGFRFLIEAIPQVLAEIPDAYFLIVGEGNLKKSLQNQAAILGIEHRVIFTGSRLDVEEILSCLDLFVSSSLWEGLPTNILESMASGVPVVATDIPGTREIIQNGYNGWLTPPRDTCALARTIVEALKDANLGRQFAERAQQTVQSFSLDLVVDKHEGIFKSFNLAWE
jgi:glycosyltransferase involved in cell wall biosynthesis